MQNKFKKTAESLLEIIMAVFIIGLGATASLTLISSAVKGNEYLKKRLIAMNLASQGLEVFINKANANMSSAEYEINTNCWRSINVASCTGTNLWGESEEDYLAILDSSMSFVILGTGNVIYNPPDEQFLIYENTEGLYTQNTTVDTTKTDFYRAIKVSKLEDSFDTVNFNDGDVLQVTSIVYFKVKNNFSKVELSTVLTNDD